MSKKTRSASMGMYSGANLPELQKRFSYKGFGKATGASKTLTFYGLARGKEYTPMTGGAGRIIIVHGIGRLVVDDNVKFEAAYVTARFKALRFARSLKLRTFYEFTDFLYETWDPKVITPATQEKLHSFMFADYNVTTDKWKEVDGRGPFQSDERVIFSTISQIHQFFNGADPSQFGKEKPVLCCRFKTISATGDTMVANGMMRSAWRVSDADDSIAYSAIGESRTRFSLEVGKEYAAYGFSVYFNGNSPPVLQPTMWAHLEESTAELAFDAVQTVDNEDLVDKYFVFTMIKFAAVSIVCPAHDCQSLVDAGTPSVLLVCARCGASFRRDSSKLQIKMVLNGVETAPMVDKGGQPAAMQGPSIENFRIAEYSVVQKLFGIERPEKLMSKTKKLHRASAEAMARLFKVTYHRESLVISNLELTDQKVIGEFDVDSDESSDGDAASSSTKQGKVREDKQQSEVSSADKKKRKGKSKKKKMAKKKKTKRARRISSSSSESSGQDSDGSDEESDASSTASLRTRSKRRRVAELAEKEAKEKKQKSSERLDKSNEEEEKEREESLQMQTEENAEKQREEEERLRQEKEEMEKKAAEATEAAAAEKRNDDETESLEK